MSADCINSVGLFLDILGVILLVSKKVIRAAGVASAKGHHQSSSRLAQIQTVRSSGRSSGNGISSGRGSPWSFSFLVSSFRLSVTTWVYWAGWSKCSPVFTGGCCASPGVVAGCPSPYLSARIVTLSGRSPHGQLAYLD